MDLRENDEVVKEQLYELGVDIFEPGCESEIRVAEAMESFASFVLTVERDHCQSIIQDHLGRSVGELQGGGDDHEIYRILITDEDSGEDGAASDELLLAFYNSGEGARYSRILTKNKIRQYMLDMCNKRAERRGSKCSYDRLGNFMFILTFGATNGQVRHIDQMDPNLQVCLYMSQNCPSTITYEMEGPEVTSARDLLQHWGLHAGQVPGLLQNILLEKSSLPLAGTFHTRDFKFWETIDDNLFSFGKLYQHVSRSYLIGMEPGTTLVAAGNQVHAGPPTERPRMFAFAIGIPSLDDCNEKADFDEDNNGEVQYSPVLLHIDLCRIVFGFVDFDCVEYSQSDRDSAKYFLVKILVELVKTYPQEPFDRLVEDEYDDLRSWLLRLTEAIENEKAIESMILEAASCDMMMFSASVRKQRTKKKKRRQNGKKRMVAK